MEDEELKSQLRLMLNCDPDDFYKKYRKYKKAEAEFKEIYEPFKDKLIQLYTEDTNIPNSVQISGVKLVYVAPSTRNIIDSKKLKEEDPELAKKYTKISNVSATIRLEDMK